MANSDKNIIITPNIGSTTDDPKIVFSSADATTAAQNITMVAYPTNAGTLSFEGSAGQLFSITNNLTGTIFSVNDISGIPSIEVDDDGTVRLAQFSGNVLIGTNTDDGTSALQVDGTIAATAITIGGTTAATEAYVTTAISNLVDTAPATLDTLNELAAALGDDANFSTTVTNSIGTKWTQDNTKIGQWDTAYSWGNHALAGYMLAGAAPNTHTHAYLPLAGGTLTNTLYARKDNVTNYTDANIRLDSYGGSSTTVGIGFHISSSIGKYLNMNSAGVLKWDSSTIWDTSTLTTTNKTNYDSAYTYSQVGHLPLSGGTLTGSLSATDIGVNPTGSSTTKLGLSLYGGIATNPVYGIMFSGTGGSGTHGSVTGDWATYFTMNNSSNRGWIFRDQTTPSNVASISNTGNATFNGTISSGAMTVSDSILVSYSGNDGAGRDAGLKIQNDVSDWGVYIKKASAANYGLRIDSAGANALSIYNTESGSTITFGVNGSTGALSSGIISATGGTSTQWNTAYSWGNHASGGYLPGSHDMTLTLSGDVTGSATFTNMGNATLTATVANDSHTHSNYVLKAGDTMTGTLISRDITVGAGYHLQRSDHHSGHLEGSYNNVAANGSKSNPIYTIGSSYNPTDAAFSNMYGIGYTSTAHTGINFTGNGMNWGMYVAADGDARVWLDGTSGIVTSTGEHYVGSSRVFHDTYHPNADKWTTARTNTVTLTGDVTGTASASVDGTGNWTVSVPAVVANDSHTHSIYAPIKRGSATISNAGWTTVCTVDGDALGSSVRMTVAGTGASTVISSILDIVCNHYLDIMVTSQTSTYTTLYVKIVSNDNEDFAVQLKTNSANSLPVNIEVFPLNNETVTFTSTNPYTGATLEHECMNGGFASSSSGGAAHGFYSNGSVLATAASVAAIAALDPVITLTGAVTGAGTMTNLGSVSITTTATSDPVLTLTGDVTGSATFTNLGNATLTTVVANDSHTHSIYLPIGGKAADSELLDGIDSSSFLRSDTADTFTGTLTMGTQQALVANAYGSGVFGLYSATRYQHVWSMGTAYKTSDDGTSYGNMYGLTWTHTNIGTGANQSIAGLSHQLQLRENGVLKCAFGTGIWTAHNITSGGQGTLWGSSNDGSGSTLDADLLDGQEGSYYYPASNPNGYQTTSGTVSYAHSVTGNAFDTTASPGSVLEYQQASGQTDTRLSPTGDWYNSIRMGHGNPYNYYSNTIAMRMTGSGSGTMFTQYIANNNPQGWRTQWDSGNDGSGSGLDADMLDGQEGSYYAPAASIGNGTLTITTSGSASGGGTFTANQSGNTTINISATDTNTTYNFSGSTFYSRNSNNPIAIDSVVDNMVGYVNTSTAAGYADGAGFSAAYSSAWVGQLFVDFRTGKLSTRGKNNGTWQAHRFMWDNLNDGSGSGLDADLLDGIDSASFLRSDADDTASGIITFSNTSNATSTASGAVRITGGLGVGYNVYANAFLRQGNTVWDAGNDGSGSGLDADLLDGLNLHNTQGTQNTPNTVLRTQDNGYTMLGWINTTSGVASGAPTRIYCSQDAYIRYYTPASLAPYLENVASAAEIYTTQTAGTAGVHYPTFVSVNASGNKSLKYDPGMMYDPSTNTLGDVNFKFQGTLTGSLVGNATTASSAPNGSNPNTSYIVTAGNDNGIGFWGGTGSYAIQMGDTQTDHGTVTDYSMHHNMGTTAGRGFTFGSSRTAVTCSINALTGAILSSNNITAYSDIRIKDNIKVIPNALDKVKQLSGYTFTRTDVEDKEKRYTGVIAQEVLKVLPEAVQLGATEEDIMSVAYGNMVGLLIEAIKELKTEVDDLKAKYYK